MSLIYQRIKRFHFKCQTLCYNFNYATTLNFLSFDIKLVKIEDKRRKEKKKIHKNYNFTK